MSRFQKLSVTAVVATFVLVVIGAAVRGTGSGLGCPDWPLCNGQIVPSLGNTSAWIEWIHRGWAVFVGLLALAIAVLALRSYRNRRSIVVASVGALVLTAFQAYLGKITVETSNSGESVTAHLAAAMLLLGTFTFIAVRARYPESLPRRGTSQRMTLLIAFSAISVYALLLFGAHVTSTGAALVYPDWPFFGGAAVPALSSDPQIAALQTNQFLHRLVAAIVGIILLGTAVIAWRGARGKGLAAGTPGAPTLLGLVGTAAALFAAEVVVGALQIFTALAPWAVTLHLALGAAVWVLLAGATFYAYFEARAAAITTSPVGGGVGGRVEDRDGAGPAADSQRPLRERVSAYVALTKPRIIELLLVTTVPAMVLARWRVMPDMGLVPFGGLVVITLVGGTLAAGSANAINCYLDRDIDLLMTRTRRRPLPAHQVAPEDALVFGLVLGVIAFAILAILVNLVAAFLTLLAIAFYVVVYTMLLKRSTPQNIVLGGAAGALPPVIGWAAVTGDITLPALLLFALVFYWTPPHFWALSMRIRGDYEAAGVPMMPVTHGVSETTRQIALYSVLMVCLSLIFFAAAHMGLVYLSGAVLLGGMFLFQAFAMWREGTDRRAVRLYKFSITYLTALFALIALDALVFLPLG
jgi:protoheme IX farnesyltransferase